MKLLRYDNYKLEISEEALCIRVFSDIWKRDKSKHKDRAIQEFGIMYFMYDPRSPYMYLIDPEERFSNIIKHEGLPNNYKMDPLLIEACEVYCNLITTTSIQLIMTAREAADKVRNFLSELDLYAEDDKGKPKYPINMIINAIKQIPDLTKQLRLAEIAIQQEIDENSKIRGQRSKALLEDGFDNFNS